MESDAKGARGRVRATVWIYVCLLRLAALGALYLTVLDTFVAASTRDLAQAQYGWPLTWVTQDLSRYQPVSFPVTIEYNWQRAWYDPLVTHYSWWAFAANTLLLGMVVVAIFGVVIALIRRRRAGKVTRGDAAR